MLIQLLVFFSLIFLNALFVAAEIALLSSRKSKLLVLTSKETPTNKFIRSMMENQNFFITTTQIGSTIMSIAIGWFGQGFVTELLRVAALKSTFQHPLFSNVLITSVIPFLAITFVMMVVGEIIPKKLTIANPEHLALKLIIPLLPFTIIFLPVIRILNHLTDNLLRIFVRKKEANKIDADYSENEIKIIINQSVKDKVIPVSLKYIIYNALRLNKVTSSQVMLHHHKIIAFSSHHTVEDLKSRIAKDNLRYARYPIFYKNTKKVIGFVEVKDLFTSNIHHQRDSKIHNTGIIKKAITVDSNCMLDKIFSQMLHENVYVAIVKGKNEQLFGVVTITDIVKELIQKF